MSLALVMLILFFGSEISFATTLDLEKPNTGSGWFVCAAQAEITIFMQIPSADMNEEVQTEMLEETEDTEETEETEETEGNEATIKPEMFSSDHTGETMEDSDLSIQE